MHLLGQRMRFEKAPYFLKGIDILIVPFLYARDAMVAAVYPI